MNGALKSNTSDKYLRPIRRQISDLLNPGAEVIDFGCGTGDLLFQLSDKINSGVGIDKSKRFIDYALKRKEQLQIENLDFIQLDLQKSFPEKKADYAIISLFFHLLPKHDAHLLLRRIIDHFQITIVCAFCRPSKWTQRLLLWLDQRFNAHYANFKLYQRAGYMEGMLEKIDLAHFECHNTFDPVIKLYVITKDPIKNAKEKQCLHSY